MTWAFEHLRSVIRHDRTSGRDLAVEVAECLDAFDGDPAALVMAARRVLAQRPEQARLWWVCARVLCATDPAAELRSTIDELSGDPTAARVAEALPFPSDDVVAFAGWSDVIPELHALRPDLDLLLIRTGTERTVASRVREHGLAVRVVDDIDAAALGVATLLVEPTVVASSTVLGSFGLVDTVAMVGAPLWIVAPTGVVLPDQLARALVAHVGARSDARLGVGYDEAQPSEEPMPLDRIDAAVGPHGVGPFDSVARATSCPVAAELLRVPMG